MLVSQEHINYPIGFYAENIQDGISIGRIIEKLKVKKTRFNVIVEDNEIKGIKIEPEDLILLLI